MNKNLRERFRKFKQNLKDFLFGMFLFELYIDTLKFAKKYKDAVNIFLFGEFLGLPIFSTPITLRLLPYFLPDLYNWRKRQLKERDITDEVPESLG